MTDAEAITAARCQIDHGGSHRYDVVPTASGRIAGECRGCHGSISAHEARDQPRAVAAHDAAVNRAEYEQRERAAGRIPRDPGDE